MFDVPVLFIIYNRPAHTKKVLEVLEVLQPAKLYVAADGPKENTIDKKLCEETRGIIDTISWPCIIKKKFNQINLSCKVSVSESISWFFENEEMGVILEDDCVPDLSFFSFCKELLNKFRNDKSVMHINGSNFILDKNFNFGNESYYYSRLPHPWGWASWRRAWSLYDIKMSQFDTFLKKDRLRLVIKNKNYRLKWYQLLEQAKNNKINTWDYQWFYSIWLNSGIVITPVVNLITNIGFGEQATNTKYTSTKMGNRRRYSLKEIRHPKEIKVNEVADAYATHVKMTDGSGNFFQKVKEKIRLIIKNKSLY
jgi:hypothetical protein